MGRDLIKFTLILLSVGLSQAVNALSIAGVETKSGLNQILDLRLAVVATEDELANLKVVVKADDEAGESLSHISYQHTLVTGEQGSYIKITSREVIREPVLNIILDLDWSNGRLIRKYSLLIDPK